MRTKAPPMPRCASCNREVGLAIADCPSLAVGACPHQFRRDRPNWKPAIFFLAFAAFWNTGVSFFFKEVVTGAMSWYGRLGLALFGTPFALGGLVTAYAAMYGLLGRRVTLYNPAQGTMWRQLTLFGVRVWREVVTSGELLAMPLDLGRELRNPPSLLALVPELSWSGRTPKTDEFVAANLVGAALLSLLAQGLLEVRRAKIDITGITFGVGDDYIYHYHLSQKGKAARYGVSKLTGRSYLTHLVAPVITASHPTVEGTLENRTLELVRNWPRSSEFEHWPLSPTIYHLVRAILGKDHSDPNRWLLDLVYQDAVARGLLTKKQERRGRTRRTLYEPLMPLDGRLVADAEAMRAMWARVVQQQPAFADAFEKEIRSGISSRLVSSE